MRKVSTAAIIFLGCSIPSPVLADHDYRGSDCYDGECYSQEYDQNYGSGDDRNRNQGRERGAFSPGPFDDSPVDAFNNLCMPGATCHYGPEEPNQPNP